MKETQRPSPPAWVLRWLERVCPADLFEMIEGDLLEEFEDAVEEFGPTRAKRRFIWSALKFFRPDLILLKRTKSTNNFKMVRHNLITSYRHLLRNKLLTVINVIGLAVGFVAFFLIARYVSFELSYDNFHTNKDLIYRVAYYQDQGGEHEQASALNFIGIRQLIDENLPEVSEVTSFDHSVESAYFQFIYNGKTFHQQGAFYQTDSSFFKVFPSLLIKGDPSKVLSDPHNIVLSQKMAKAIFGDQDPIGQKIDNRSYSYSEAASFVVSGLMIDVPENAHFHLNIIALEFHEDDFIPDNDWTHPEAYTYITLDPLADPLIVTEKINTLLRGVGKTNPNVSNTTVSLQAITAIHNASSLSDELEPNGNATLLYILSAIAAAILICALINYVNIESGILLSRTKEIGVRKTLGSTWSTITFQFYTEYLLATGTAIGLATIIWYAFQQPLSGLLNLPMFSAWTSPAWLSSFAFFTMAVLITGFIPMIALKNFHRGTQNGTNFTRSFVDAPVRKVLIGFQFTCSIALIAVVMIVQEQLAFMMSTNKKIDIENIVSIRNPTVYTNDDSLTLVEYGAFRNTLLSNSMIKNVTGSSAIPGMSVEVTFTNRLKRNLGDPFNATPYKVLFIDYDYLPFYDLNLKAGRNFSTASGEDESWTTVILNESAARSLGFETAEGAKDQEVYFHLWGNDFKKYRIIGVVEDYHQETAKKVTEPIILSLNHRYFQQVFYSVKLNKDSNPQEALTAIETAWESAFPEKPFHYFFQDEYYDRQFKTERKFSSVFGLFAGVTILIACLGIVGMTLFESTARIKEVTIRKVLGATVINLVALLTSSYVRILAIAAVCCVPIILFLSHLWLDTYATRIEVSFLFFVLPILGVGLLVTLSSVWQTTKAALTNPVDHLRHN